MLNRVILMGRITHDLEVRQTSTGQTVLSFQLAVDRRVKAGAEKQSDFIRCTAWGQQAEFISRYFGRGRMIAIEGSLRSGSYEKNGQTINTVEVWIDSVSFTGEPKQNGGYQNGGYNNGGYQNGGYNNNGGYQNGGYNNNGGYNPAPQQNNYQQPAAPAPQQNMSIGNMDDFEEIISDEGVPF